MKCDDLNDVLVDFVDGRLDPDARTLRGGVERDVERHLEVCAQCGALVMDLRTIRAAAFMLDRREPPAALWTALQEKIAAEPAPTGRLIDIGLARRTLGRSFSGGGAAVWLAAAAALILATLIGVLPLMDRQPTDDHSSDAAPAADVTVESVAAEFEAAEKHYQKAIDDLQTIANADTGELDPQLAAVLQKNLTVIDQAINESRAALKSQPASSNAQEGLFDALTTKVALLQQTVELINEMRKGNQAEAGRKIQTLSQ